MRKSGGGSGGKSIGPRGQRISNGSIGGGRNGHASGGGRGIGGRA